MTDNQENQEMKESEIETLRRHNRRLAQQLESTNALLSLTHREMHYRSEICSDQVQVDELIECLKDACQFGVNQVWPRPGIVDRWIAAIDKARGRSIVMA